MAKVFYSALVNRMSGKISNSVMSNWKGQGIIKKHNASPHQPHTEKQQAVRGYLNDLAGEYYSLTATQKGMWDAWAGAIGRRMTSLNAYASFNQLAQKYFPGQARMTTPPPSPNTPIHPTGLSVVAKAASDFSVIWTGPTLTTLYAVVDYWPMPGLDNTVSPSWTFGATAGCDTTFATITTTYPVGTVLKFRVRTIDAYKRTSPWSHMLSSTAIT